MWNFIFIMTEILKLTFINFKVSNRNLSSQGVKNRCNFELQMLFVLQMLRKYVISIVIYKFSQ